MNSKSRPEIVVVDNAPALDKAAAERLIIRVTQ
jgi:hypothetical protein